MPKRSPIALRVWGDYALFARPEAKAERLSYDVITPSAARGVLEAIYWKPAVRWVIDQIHVYKEPHFTNLRRNEVGSKASASNAKQAMKGTSKGGPLALYADEDRQQRAATILRDVEYVIEARFELVRKADQGSKTDGIEKHFNMFKRRAERGQYFHHPYLGTREFPCDFEWVDGPIPESPLKGERDLGFMLHDLIYTKVKKAKDADTVTSGTGEPFAITPQFFRAIMRDGVIDVPKLPELSEADLAEGITAKETS